MNILFINNYYHLFKDADCGASVRSMRFIKALAEHGHVDVVSFVDNTVSNIPNVSVIYSRGVDSIPIIRSRFEHLYILFQFHNPYAIYYPLHEKENILDQIISSHEYDLIVIRYIYYACECGVLKYAKKLIIDIDDDPKQVALMSLKKNENFIKRIYQQLYANTIDMMSRYVIRMVKGAFYSTPDMNYENACLLPNISISQHPMPPTNFNERYVTILMVGWFKYFPNKDGLHHFITKIFPEVKSSIPNAVLNVVGKLEDEDLIKLCKMTDGVNILGFVENLEEQYCNCNCVVVPIYKGTGTSVKLVEAMSLRRAVVSSPCGARGLNSAFVPNKDFYLAESDDDFARKVVYLLTHPEENIAMANIAYSKIKQWYSEEMFNNIVSSVIMSKRK